MATDKLAYLDDLVCEAQDAFFAEDFTKSADVCRKALSISKDQPDMFQLLATSLQLQQDYNGSSLAAHQWIEKYGANWRNIRILAENNYLLSDLKLLDSNIRELLENFNESDEQKELNLSVLAFASAFAADLRWFSLKNKVVTTDEIEYHTIGLKSTLNLLEKYGADDDRLKVLLGWIYLKINEEANGIKLLIAVINAHSDDDGLAAALLTLHLMDKGNLSKPRKFIDETLSTLCNARPLQEVDILLQKLLENSSSATATSSVPPTSNNNTNQNNQEEDQDQQQVPTQTDKEEQIDSKEEEEEEENTADIDPTATKSDDSIKVSRPKRYSSLLIKKRVESAFKNNDVLPFSNYSFL